MKCEPCYGRGVFWYVEPEGKGTGEIWNDPFNKKNPGNGSRVRKGWYERCLACNGEGLRDEKRTAKRIEFCIGQSLSLHAGLIPENFGLNTPENQAWKIGSEKIRASANESVWLASNSMLLIVHGDQDWKPDIQARKELERTPAVEAKYYAWLNPGVFTGKYVGLLIKALKEWNSLAPAPEVAVKSS